MKVKEILNKSLSERLPAARRISRFPSACKILRLSSHRSVFRISHLSFHAAQNNEWRSPPRRHPERSERKMCACLRQNSCRLSRRISRFPSACKILRLSSHRSVFRFSHLSFHIAAQNDEWRSPPRRHPERSERKMCACLGQNTCRLSRRISRFPSACKILRLSSHRSVFRIPTCHSIPPLRMTLTISYISHAFDKSTHSGFKR